MKILQKICFVLLLTTFSSVYGGVVLMIVYTRKTRKCFCTKKFRVNV